MTKHLKKVIKIRTAKNAKEYKKIILRNILRIRIGITEAAKYRITEDNYTFEEKVENLRKDVENVANHVFGDHEKCATYFCTGQPKDGEINIVPELKKLGLFDSIQKILNDLSSSNAESLLRNRTSNIVESFNSVVNKKIGWKAKSISQRGAYPGRVALAVVQFNSRRPASRLNEYFGYMTPNTAIEMENRRMAKNERNMKNLRDNKKKRKEREFIFSDDNDEADDVGEDLLEKKRRKKRSGKEDYGETCIQPDMTEEQFKHLTSFTL